MKNMTMLPRFCRFCYQVFDESIVNLRRFSVKHSAVSEHLTDDERDDYKQHSFEDKDTPLEKSKRRLIIKCKRSQFNYYEGDTYPKFEPIPLASRGWQHRDSRGDYFTIYPFKDFDEDQINTSLSFKDINLHKELVNNLEQNGIINPTPIQKLGIPKILEGQNVMLTAETGCGKTFAFLVPMLQQIIQWKPMHDRGFNRPLGIIITPSRELAVQIAKEAKKLTKNLGINIVTLTGGKTKKIIQNPPVGEVDLIVATIGVISKLVATDIYKLKDVRHVVLDEADTLFDITFKEKIMQFLRKIPIAALKDPNESYPSSAQLTLNSATIPQNIYELLGDIVESSSLLPVTTGYEHYVRVPQKFFRLSGSEKPMMLLKLMKPKAKSKIPVIIFCNTSESCDFTKIFLQQYNIKSVNLHGNMPLDIRRGKFSEFISGRYNILTTTDAGARGLDTTEVRDVINFDFPLITSEYIHRCGRIGRIGSPKDGKVINFISRPLEIILTRKIEFATRKMKPIPMVDMIHDEKGEDGEFYTTTVTDDKYESQSSRDETEFNDSKNHYNVPQ